MKLNKKSQNPIDIMIKFIAICVILFIFMIFLVIAKSSTNSMKIHLPNILNSENDLTIISSSENEDLEEIIQKYARLKGYRISIQYAGTLEIMQRLNAGEQYDAVWLSNSIWMYMLDSNIRTSNSKCTSINPVVFGIKKSKAKELAFLGKTVYTKDIVDAISSGKLKFSMSNPTSTNSGASAYLGMLSTLAGNPEVLTKEHLQSSTLKNKLTSFFSGMERSSGSEEFLEQFFLNGDYEAVVTYESSIIHLNQQLKAHGKEPLYAIYPVDGVSIADSPFAFIGNDSDKKEIFIDIQSYILSDEGQKLLQEKGRRTWYGGITNKVDTAIFNPDWGIQTNQYISPVKYPSTAVIKLALNLYQSELRKPTHVIFCLDYSGSMTGKGNSQLMDAMDYILTDKAANDLLQFSEKDKIDVIPFGTKVYNAWSTTKGNETDQILEEAHAMKPTGSTALYPAAIKALQLLQSEDADQYNISIILMTDGEGNVGNYSDLVKTYKSVEHQIPIYSIMFGSARETQLEKIAELTNGKVFDGKTDLVKAFKEVRGYN